MEKDLYIGRSFSACIKAAYILFGTNLKTIFRKTWLPAMVYAAFMTAVTTFMIPDFRLNEAGNNHVWTTVAIMTMAYVGSFVSSIWLTSATASLLNGTTVMENFKKAVLLNVFIYLYIVLTSAISSNFMQGVLQQLFTMMKLSPDKIVMAYFVVAACMMVLVTAFMIPFTYSSTKYLFDHSTTLRQTVTSDYTTGLRRWGFIFKTIIIIGLIISIISLVVSVPFIILLMAQIANQMGMIYGDPDTAPEYFYILFKAVTFVTMFIFAYESIWAFLVQYYVYGSIHTQDMEKKKQKENGENRL